MQTKSWCLGLAGALALAGGVAAAERTPKQLLELGRSLVAARESDEDVTRGARALAKAAKGGQASAHYYLGVCFERGLGVPRDEAKAFQRYRAAAKKGVVEALYKVGLFVQAGRGGATRDLEKAEELLRKAASTGHAGAWEAMAAGPPEPMVQPLPAAMAEIASQPVAESLAESMAEELDEPEASPEPMGEAEPADTEDMGDYEEPPETVPEEAPADEGEYEEEYEEEPEPPPEPEPEDEGEYEDEDEAPEEVPEDAPEDAPEEPAEGDPEDDPEEDSDEG